MASMEDKLEKLSLGFATEIAEKVLKRCFKVPHLALRFFNWVKEMKKNTCDKRYQDMDRSHLCVR